ncbi:RNA ligase [Streptomyces sp. ALI-76-A]|uniref:RNA ligase n=1 Tax=Streptomyces sp. ALI-76-A TaxID=3025736 RepID=UPI00256EEAB9|nr:RNA ligase [Streptomyces sp. ALI-76-A]MDL5199592.1 RNA ligase [Streptomyces sp. ALI-76-A]
MHSHIDDLLDPALLARSLDAGYVREQTHPTLPLRIFNYAEKAVFEREWNEVTRQCRGLITDRQGRILAGPYAKFFNYSEHPEGTFDLDDKVLVTDKLDGSLGILYPLPDGGHAIAPRGSFASEQALHATQIWQERYADTASIKPGVTYLFEIIFPENRIVCDYGTLDDLVLLGGVDIATGTPLPADELPWDGPRVDTFAFNTLADALAASPRPGAEGFVLRFPGHDNTMIKIKQDDYVALHRIITGLNARAVWERLGAGDTVAEICDGLPDEFHDWVRDVAAELAEQCNEILAEALEEHQRIVEALPEGRTRKEYAVLASRSPMRAWLFMLLDGRDPSARIFHTLRPEADIRPVNATEDNS